ncbi:APH(3') family aminoglycoside O-phosphotransferase [Phyllobacterium sp. YR531]|uniref:APH(3') family aminoglycoside O-phosphotransferase n=1 Tax=Phyllobacterium sp. YR531 TaxID=1144343 RepID=UPI00026F6CF7|nr:APH(3') family aminoglycoside O-phosphotransferase [Phyllobacterium sp. YR531]EJN01620.1 aminoglycoside phosphotransferase [Phyllobacterium sp. YR531]
MPESPEHDAHIPPDWRGRLAHYGWTAQTIGESGALVFRLEASGLPTLFVKSEIAGEFGELPDEISRLRWLAGQGIAAPKVLDQTEDNGRIWLLMSALPGRDLASDKEIPAENIVRIAAQSLKDLHSLDIAHCPFNHTLSNRIPVAHARMIANQVDESDFDEVGPTAAELFERLLKLRSDGEDLVVTHGDACLPNILSDGSVFTGFVDCARLGIADRYQDLALASRSIEHNLGVEWVEPFFRSYGVDMDSSRVEYYRLLDEFF